MLSNVRQEILMFFQEKLKNNFPIDDYKEFLQLIVIFLGDIPPSGIKFRQPGSYHLARCMAKGIYCLKMLFQNKFNLYAIKKSYTDHLLCYKKCYTETWITVSDALQAPLNGIYFIKKLESYKTDDKITAEVALKKIS